MPCNRGFSPLPRESCSPESEACFFSFQIKPFLNLQCASSAATRTLRFCTAIISRARWTLPVTSCSCRVPRPFMDGIIRQGFTPSCRIPNHTCSHDVTRTLKKTNLAIRGVLHASTCALPVRNLRHALCEQNTPRRSRRVSHTCPRKEPIQSEFTTQPGLCPSAGLATPLRAFPDRASTSQPCTRGSRTLHSTDHLCAAVQTRDGNNCNYCRYPAFVPP